MQPEYFHPPGGIIHFPFFIRFLLSSFDRLPAAGSAAVGANQAAFLIN